jgi:hypothetical protein
LEIHFLLELTCMIAFLTVPTSAHAQIDGGRGLAHAALLINDGNHLALVYRKKTPWETGIVSP